MTIRRLLLVVAAALIPIMPNGQAQAQQSDVIRGRVTGPDSAALANAGGSVYLFNRDGAKGSLEQATVR